MDANATQKIACLVLIGLLSITTGCTYVHAEDGAASEEEVNTGQDFARPLYRFDVRSELEQSGSEEMLTWTFRADAPMPLGELRGFGDTTKGV